MQKLESEILELMNQNGSGTAPPYIATDKAARVALIFVQREMAKVKAGVRNKELLAVAGRIMAGLASASRGEERVDFTELATQATHMAKALIDAVSKEAEDVPSDK